VEEKENAIKELSDKLKKVSQEHDDQKKKSKEELGRADLKLKELVKANASETQELRQRIESLDKEQEVSTGPKHAFRRLTYSRLSHVTTKRKSNSERKTATKLRSWSRNSAKQTSKLPCLKMHVLSETNLTM
jgi:hypothetical protein